MSRRTTCRTAASSALRAWTAFVEHGDGAAALVRPEILKSWRRSQPRVSRDVAEAPLDDESEARAFWHDSPLQRAVSSVEAELRRTAEDGDLVLAVTDAQTRILWTYGGRVMRRKAESVNFVPAARWDDESVGTNALDLANRLRRAEHGLQRRALRADRAQLGLLGRAGARPGHRRPARRRSTSRRPGTAPTRSASPPRGCWPG